MLLSASPPPRRRAVAAVEFACVAPLLVVLLAGIWEVGRMIQLQQILSNAAREGARLAAQGLTINSTGTQTLIKVNTGDPSIQETVYNYLKQDGLNLTTSDVTVTFQYLNGDTSRTEPYQASKGQLFRVTVTVPMNKVRWSAMNLFQPVQMSSSVVWASLVDDPFSLDTTLPSW